MIETVQVIKSSSMGFGYHEVHKTVVRSEFSMSCGCGEHIVINIRKKIRKHGPFEVKVTHKNRERNFTAKELKALPIWRAVMHCAGYALCAPAGMPNKSRSRKPMF